MGNSSMKAVPGYEDFRVVAGEYEKLRAAGLSMEEIYSLLAMRLQKSLTKGDGQTGDLIGIPKIIGPGSRDISAISPEQFGMHLQQDSGDYNLETKEPEFQPLPVIQRIVSYSNGVVLLIDDSPVAAKVASKVLTALNFEVVVANSAQTGFDILMTRKDDINLVFLDVVMPNVDGVECLGWIKDCPDVAHIPVYMLSGLEDNMLAEVCVERGAEGMLLKPLKPDLVKDIMKSQNIGHLDDVPVMRPTPPTTNKPSQPTPHTPQLITPPSFMQTSRAPGSPTKKPARTAVMISVGSQAPAFKLLDSDMNEYIFPQPNMKKNIFLVFMPTLYIGSLFDSDGGFLRRFFNYFDYLSNSKKVEIAFVTGDLPFALKAAKDRFKMPVTLLSDPSLFVCQKYVGIIDIGKLQCFTDTVNQDNRDDVIDSIDNRQHSSLAPCLGMVLLSRTRDVLCKWVANLSDGDTNPNFKQFPGNFDHWLPIATDVHAAPMTASQSAENNSSLGDAGATSKSVSNTNINSQSVPAVQPSAKAMVSSNKAMANAGPAAEDTTNKKTALVVDDSSISSRIVCKKLEDMGFAVKHSYNGQIAYEQLRKSPQAFDIVLTDIIMPVCDGLTLLRLVKQDRALEHLPVVMLSGLEGNDIDKTAAEQGALAVLRKPFNVAEFTEIIKTKLQWS